MCNLLQHDWIPTDTETYKVSCLNVHNICKISTNILKYHPSLTSTIISNKFSQTSLTSTEISIKFPHPSHTSTKLYNKFSQSLCCDLFGAVLPVFELLVLNEDSYAQYNSPRYSTIHNNSNYPRSSTTKVCLTGNDRSFSDPQFFKKPYTVKEDLFWILTILLIIDCTYLTPNSSHGIKVRKLYLDSQSSKLTKGCYR